jgi:hypothetical protein
MFSRWLRFLGAEPPAASSAAPEALRLEGAVLEVGSLIELARKRSPWSPQRLQERVLLGSHPGRADVRLEGPGICPEHLRFYLPRDGKGPDDLRAIVEGTVWVNGRALAPLEWHGLAPGDEIRCGPWRFRFEREEG